MSRNRAERISALRGPQIRCGLDGRLGQAMTGAGLLMAALSCLLVAPVQARAQGAGMAIDSATYQRVVDENLDLRKEQARLERELGELRRRNASLSLDIQDLERKRDQLTALVAQLKTPDEQKAELARLQAEKLVLVREIERLRQSLAAATRPVVTNTVEAAPAPAAPAPAAGSDLFRKLEKENADLRAELAKARETSLNESVAKELLGRREGELKSQVETLTATHKRESEALAVAQRREAALKKALETQARKAFDASEGLRVAKTETETQKETLRKFQSEMDKAKAQVEALQKEKKAREQALVTALAGAKGTTPDFALQMEAGRAALAAGNASGAETAYLKAYRLEPKNAQVNYNLGVLYADYLKDGTRAVRYLRRYLELAPKSADASLVRSWILELEAKARW